MQDWKPICLHDYSILSISVDWKNAIVTICCSGFNYEFNEINTCQLNVLEFSKLIIPRFLEWGYSDSILECIGPTIQDNGKLKLLIEMQSGDIIRLEGKEITNTVLQDDKS